HTATYCCSRIAAEMECSDACIFAAVPLVSSWHFSTDHDVRFHGSYRGVGADIGQSARNDVNDPELKHLLYVLICRRQRTSLGFRSSKGGDHVNLHPS